MNIVLILLFLINGISSLQNGIPVDPQSTYFNYVATIWQNDYIAPQYLCSGSIITELHIITAGHCVHNVRNYDIHVTVGRIDLHDGMSVMVHQIYLHHNFRRIYNHYNPLMEFWLNDIAILDVVTELIWGPHIARISLSLREWTDVASTHCYISGWSYISIDRMISAMTLEQANAAILGNRCRLIDTFLLSNEIHAFITTPGTTLDDRDIGNSLICDNKAVGIIVGGRNSVRHEMTVLTLIPYKGFIDYITAGGVVKIEDGNFGNAVFISNSIDFRCGGFMVHNRYVVTAAQCIQNIEITHLLVASVDVTSVQTDFLPAWSSVESLEIHPFYNSIYNERSKEYNIENNIVILKLKRDLPWNPSIRLMDLPDLNQISANRPCEIVRWNLSSSGGTPSKLSMKSFGRILSSEASTALGFHLRPNKFLTTGIYRQPIATEHDIGSPIIFENNIIGMVIAVTGYPDPVTCLKILPYQEFIRSFMNRTSNSE